MRTATLLFILIFWIAATSPGQQRSVALTFDDLPATFGDYDYITQRLLAALNEEDIPAIGFVNESKLYTDGEADSGRIRMLEKWLEAGMELGNHSYSHIYIDRVTVDEYKQDVLKGERITRPLLESYDSELRYYRHTQLRTGPTEAYRRELNRFLSEAGYRVAPVTIDNDEYIYAYCYERAAEKGDSETIDLISKEYLDYMTKVFSYYEKLSTDFLGFEPKQILLLHANLLNAELLPELIDMLQSRSYSFISLDEALTDSAYSLPVVQSDRGLSWLHRWMLAQGEKPPDQPRVPPRIRQLFNDYQR